MEKLPTMSQLVVLEENFLGLNPFLHDVVPQQQSLFKVHMT